MKRSTKGWLREQCVGMTHAHGRAQDALDSDARQRAEIRRLREALKTISNPQNWGGDGGWNEASYPDEIARKALTKRKAKRNPA